MFRENFKLIKVFNCKNNLSSETIICLVKIIWSTSLHTGLHNVLSSVQEHKCVWVLSKRLPDCVVQYKTTIISLLLKHIHVKSYLKTRSSDVSFWFHHENKNKLISNIFQTFYSATTQDLPMKDLKRLLIGYNLSLHLTNAVKSLDVAFEGCWSVTATEEMEVVVSK